MGYCEPWPTEEWKCNSVVTARTVVASISFCGCLFIIATIIFFRKYRYFPQRLIFFLSIAAFLDSIAYLMGDVGTGGSATSACIFQAWWLSFFDWSVLLWVCCITANLYYNIIKHQVAEHLEKWFHLLCWGWPALMAFIPLWARDYGHAGVWCWIEDSNTAMRFVVWYVPLFVLIFGMAAVYGYIALKVKRQAETWSGSYTPEMELQKELMREHIKPLRLYPIIYLVCSIFGLINRIQNAANPGNPVFGLAILHAIFAPLQGVLNAVAYGLDKETMKRCNMPSIRAAMARRSDKRLVQEYPVSAASPESDDSAVSDVPSSTRDSDGFNQVRL